MNVRKLLMFLLTLPLVSIVSEALAEETQAPPSQSETESVETYQTQRRSSREIIDIVVPLFPKCRFRSDEASDLIVVEGTPDRLEKIDKVLRSLDVSREPVDLKVHLLWGRKSNLKVPLPKEVSGAETELRRLFKFGRFDLVNSMHVPTLDQTKGKVSLMRDCTLEWAIDKVESPTGTIDIRINVSQSGVRGGQVRTILETATRLKKGVPTVLGGIPFEQNVKQTTSTDDPDSVFDRRMILILEADIPEKATLQTNQ